MDHVSWLGWTALGSSALLIGVSKTGFPGVAILAILLTAMVVPAKESTGLILPMLIVGDIFAVAYYRRHAVWKHLVKLIPFAAVGIVIGSMAMGKASDAQVRVFIGSVILAMLALNWVRTRRGNGASVPTGAWFPICIGLAAGVTTMMANAAGPIMVVYLLAMRLPKDEFIGTGAWYYLLLNCFKVPFSGSLNLINWQSLQLNLIMLPGIVVGALAGVRLVKHVPEKVFANLVQALAVLGAAWLLVGPFVTM
jgi:uncharacterized membrane protein YfcA